MTNSMLDKTESFRPELLFALVGRLLIIILFIEVMIMLGFHASGLDQLPDPISAVLDGLLLTALSAPPIYFWIIVPVLHERRRADDMMHLLAAAIHNSGEAILITDAEGTIQYVNPAFTQVTGYSPSEAMGNNPRILQSGRQNKAFYTEMWGELTRTGRWQGKVWNKRKNGEIYHEALSIRAIYDAQRRVTHYLGTFTDTTEQELMEQALHRAQKLDALGTLVGGVAHNFNNLIAGIAGKSYLAQRQAKHPEVIEQLRDIDHLSDRASAIVKQLLLFSREARHDKQHVNLTMLFKSACQTARLGVPENITFETDFSSEDMIAFADAAQLEQVLLNLINNARDACMGQAEPKIRVSLQRLDWDACDQKDKNKICASEIACLQVEDNGHGIPEDEIEHIFEPFYTTKEEGKGTGLGLAMSYGAVESHGGIIDVQSEVGRGSIFMVGIPILNEARPSKTEVVEEVVEADESDDRLILVVDDEEMIRSTLSQILQSLGYKVVVAENGIEACELFDSMGDRIALVLTDHVMPKMNGEEAVARMREKRPDLPAVILSGYNPEETDINEITKRLGKPFRIAEISRLTSELLKAGSGVQPKVR